MNINEMLASTASAQSQMRFQERMSNTAHQREVADLKAAGLNPVLSAGGSGASTPNGAAGDYSAVFGLLSQSMDNSAKAISTLGKSMEDAIKAGIEKGESAASNVQAFTDLKNALQIRGVNTGSDFADDVIGRFADFIPDGFSFYYKGARITGKDLKDMMYKLEAPSYIVSAEKWLKGIKDKSPSVMASAKSWLKDQFYDAPREYFGLPTDNTTRKTRKRHGSK